MGQNCDKRLRSNGERWEEGKKLEGRIEKEQTHGGLQAEEGCTFRCGGVFSEIVHVTKLTKPLQNMKI